ncbi:c-type cytochrome [Phenylobacterium sp.]|uniref:c-type cytochrome n=1 Tax=Phenylobacterium sp. TaxID=1871053 RepID=UPI0025E4B13F|nr:c-type cytochrome [Phenylobacterium sp.]
MRRAGLIIGLAAGAGLLLAGQLRAQDGPKSVWDGVYTDAQAERGKAAYTQSCVFCHGPDLAGTGEAKPLAGPEFLSSWNGLSVGELLDRTRTTMPQEHPGSLERSAYADILAYLLKFNGYPAGPTELAQRSEFLTGVRIDAFKPDALKPAASAADAFATDAFATVADAAPNSQPNPYASDTGFFKLPPGRTMGSSSAVGVDSRGHIWVADRCGANNCAGSPLDPVMEFDGKGNFIKAFGAGMLLFPHGLFIDAHDHIWLTDGHSQAGKGAQVFEFDASGKVLRTLGKAGVSAEGPDTFAEPNAVLVTQGGTIFVADGHTPGRSPQRIVKFDASGKFLKQWGGLGASPGQLEMPHTLAMDSRGRLFVGDRGNNRIQIYDQDGKLLDSWRQFGRPSGIFIDKADVLYVGDSESRAPVGYGHNPGWTRGLRIGSARTGQVTAFIPDTEPNPDKQSTSGAEGITADRHGVVYGAQVLQKAVVRYVRK